MVQHQARHQLGVSFTPEGNFNAFKCTFYAVLSILKTQKEKTNIGHQTKTHDKIIHSFNRHEMKYIKYPFQNLSYSIFNMVVSKWDNNHD